MSAPELTIPIHALDAGGRHYVFPIRAAWIRSQLEGQEAAPAGPDGELDVRVSKSGNDVVVHGTLKARLTIPCARCLEPATIDIDDPISVLMVPAHTLKLPEGEYEFGPEEADVLPYEGDNLVLDSLVRDELLLEIPMIPLCSEGCPGISAGTPPEEEKPAVDPRLQPLRRFMQKKDKKE
jgi:DUF177 domain-containing protein